MLTFLHLQNFKCFDQLSLPLAPLTLLTGVNAGGKSSALQTLLLLGQALRSEPHSRWISLRGPLVNLGTYRELVNAGREIALGVESRGASLLWRLAPDEGHWTRATLTAVINNYDRAAEVEYAINQDTSIDRLLPFSPDTATSDLIHTIRNVIYISVARAGTEMTFPSPEYSDPVQADVGAVGQHAAWWLAQFLDDEVSSDRLHPKETGTTLRRQVGAWASDLVPGAEANATSLDRTGLVQLQLRTRINEDWRRPANIGYGLSYAFPILVAALLANKGQVLVVDSPEAHLHPRAQSLMGRFLAAMAAAGVQIIIETHSDHILNGVRISVKDKVLHPEQAAVHFFTRPGSAEAPHVATPKLDAQGGLSAWPDGFFDQAERDLAYLAGWT